MSKQLAMNTTVEGETYKAGSVPPPEVAKKITNPKCWGDAPKTDKDESPAETVAPPAQSSPPAAPPAGPPPSAPPAPTNK